MTSSVGGSDPSLAAFRASQADAMKEMNADAVEVQNESLEATQASLADETKDITLPQKKLEKAGAKDELKTKKAEQAQESVLVMPDEADQLSNGFANKNPKFHLPEEQMSNILQSVGTKIKPDSRPEDILKELREGLRHDGQDADITQIDKTFDFLIEVMKFKAQQEKVGEAKTRFQTLEKRFTEAQELFREQNKSALEESHELIGVVDHLVQKQDGATLPGKMKEIREIIHNPQDFSSKWNFYTNNNYSFRQIKEEMDDILSYIGSDYLPEELQRGKETPKEFHITKEMEGPAMIALRNEECKVWAILQIFRKSKGAEKQGDIQFEMQELTKPKNLNFEAYAKTFMKLVDERYPAADKILNHISALLDLPHGGT